MSAPLRKLTILPSREHYLLRIGDGVHFRASSSRAVWGVHNKTAMKGVLNRVKKGDFLWFVLGGTKGKLLAVAEYVSQNERVTGPLIALTATNEELGWTETPGDWDVEIHYKGLKWLDSQTILTEIKGGAAGRQYKGATTTPVDLRALSRTL